MTTPHFFRLTADADRSAPPALPPQLSRIVARAGVTLPDGKMSVPELDKLLAASSLTTVQKIDIKGALARAGRLVG